MGVWNAVIESDTLIERKKFRKRTYPEFSIVKRLFGDGDFFYYEAAGIISVCPLKAMISCV